MRKAVNEIFIKEFGENLRKIRLSKKISMQTLAHTINVEYSQISRIELGKINTTINTIYEISVALEVPLNEFFNFKKN
ncbi:helix-turn-helix domain-containing protein [Flavobacterium sp.]|uniref:helix-turn-helix domain-containing protein n=1 Tax=Flavobacterium sp. TaxID=239 RepID=UPI003753C7AE